MLDHGITTQWFPCMAFPKHSRPPAWRYLFMFFGPSQSEAVSYFGSWDTKTYLQVFTWNVDQHLPRSCHLILDGFQPHREFQIT